MTQAQKATSLILDLDSDFSDYKEDSLNIAYRWRLKQLDKLGEQIGRDYFPYRGAVEFKVTEITASHIFGLYKDDGDFEGPVPLESKHIGPNYFAQSAKKVVRIQARLERFSQYHKVSCFGSDEPIENFELMVKESDEERCVISILENVLYVTWSLPMPALMELMQEVRTHSASQMKLFLSKCDGLYTDSEWLGQTYTPKLLDHRSHIYEELVIPEECTIPVVGFVGDVSFCFEDRDDVFTDSPSDPSAETIELGEIRAQLKSLIHNSYSLNRYLEWLLFLAGLAVISLFFSIFQ